MASHAGLFFVTRDFKVALAIVPLPALHDLVSDMGELVPYRGDLIDFDRRVVH
jgi:hypothetical protein